MYIILNVILNLPIICLRNITATRFVRLKKKKKIQTVPLDRLNPSSLDNNVYVYTL